MSYSFTVVTDTKGQARDKVAVELAKVVVAQPMHDKDLMQAQSAADKFIDLLAEDNTKGVRMSMSGSLSWADDGKITGTSISINASLVVKEPA